MENRGLLNRRYDDECPETVVQPFYELLRAPKKCADARISGSIMNSFIDETLGEGPGLVLPIKLQKRQARPAKEQFLC